MVNAMLPLRENRTYAENCKNLCATRVARGSRRSRESYDAGEGCFLLLRLACSGLPRLTELPSKPEIANGVSV
jgi:hypothetical protein